MRYDVCYADDLLLPVNPNIQDDTIKVEQESLEQLLNYEEWNDFAVKRFLSNSFAKTKKFESIRYSGYTSPAFLIRDIRSGSYNPKAIQLDWDFGTFDAEYYIEELLQITSAKIFVLTGNKSESEIKSRLEDKFPNISDTRGLKVFSKSIHEESLSTHENLTEEIIADFSSISEERIYRNLTIRFFPSSFLPSFNSFWMLESIFGESYLISSLKENDLVVSKDTVERIFEKSTLEYYINTKGNKLYSKQGLSYAEYFNDKLIHIKPIKAIYEFDLAILEEAQEKCYSIIPNNENRV